MMVVCGFLHCDTVHVESGYQYYHLQNYSVTERPKSELLDMYPLTILFSNSAN
jgi:hypothetical protein